MMDFEGVEKVRARVRQNGTLAQQLLQLQGQMAVQRLTAALSAAARRHPNGAGHPQSDGTGAGGGCCPRHDTGDGKEVKRDDQGNYTELDGP